MKKVKYILFSSSLLLFSGVIFAQQESITTIYKDQMNIVNPAFAGLDKETNVSVGFRKQWVGITNAPETQTLVFGTSVGKNLGIGVSAVNDKTFIEKQTNFGIDFSYKLKVAPELDMYLGLKAGGNFYEVNTSGLGTFNTVSDPALVSYSSFKPNFGVGAVLRNEKYFFSLSVPRILNTVRSRNEDAQNYVATNRPHLYVSGGYDYDLDNASEMILKPSFLMRFVDGAPASIDYNLGLSFFKTFEVGAMYRSSDAIGGIAKINISKRLLFGYAYEATTRSDMANRLNTHEFLLKYKFK
jgi:type IX secretion system PorP/SprF family membrane protein